MANREQLHDFVEQLPGSGLEDEPIDAETADKLDAARAEGGPSVSIEEVKRRYHL
jgi:hypothetical protein